MAQVANEHLVELPQPSLEGLIAWLETKNPRKRYAWSGGSKPCLIEQYAESIGLSRDEVHAINDDGENIYYRLSIANGCLAYKQPHTFGAALERARDALARSPAERSA